MSSRNVARWGSLGIVLAAATLAWAWGAVQPNSKPEELLPAGAVLYARWDGGEQHAEAWQQTAAYDAVHDSGLDQLWGKVVEYAKQKAPRQANLDVVFETIQHAMEQGASMAVTLADQGPIPRLTLVLHEAGGLEPRLGALMTKALEREVTLEQRNEMGRTVTSGTFPDSPGVEIGWWAEGAHLVVVVGPGAVDAGLAVATGKAENVTADPLYAKHVTPEAEFEVTSVGWIDFTRVRERFGSMPLPPQAGRRLVVNDVLAALGLDGLNTIAARGGYDGRAIRSDWTIDAPAPRRGLLALIDQQPISLDDLPPLPADVAMFKASGFDWVTLYEAGTGIARELAKLGPPQAAEKVDGVIRALPQIAGFDPRADLLEPLGNVTCFYADGSGGLLGMGLGLGLAVSVDDATRLRGTLDRLTERLARTADPKAVAVLRTKIGAREMVSIEVGGGFVNPTYSVGDKWLVIGIAPTTVRAFALREEGKLPKWSAEDHEILAFVPEEFGSLTYADPRPGVETLANLAPMLIGFAQGGMRQSGEFEPGFRLPITAADLPPAELITRPLFPNVSVATASDAGVKVVSKSSLPAIPSIDGGGAAVPVLVALLLPAVQQAREAARRAQSTNNLKQTAIALHNYHDVNKKFPRGTVENADLKPAERLSWMVEVLPYVEQQAVYQGIDRSKGWNDDANKRWTEVTMPVWMNPGSPVPADKPGTTNYVGIAGLGKDAAELPLNSPKAGAFGYDRALKFSDVTDGLSNTVGVAEATGEFGHWAEGGTATIRGFSEKPYINGPDGIGGPFRGGAHFMLLDGSVRFVSENVDPSIVEGISTIRGNEAIQLP